MSHQPDYFTRLAAAYVRGRLQPEPVAASHGELFARSLDELSEEERAALIELGVEHGLRLHRFKRTMGLPRVARVLGALRGIGPRHRQWSRRVSVAAAGCLSLAARDGAGPA